MYRFQIVVQARPPAVRETLACEIDGQRYAALAVAPQQMLPMRVSFERAAQGLEALPRLFFEPDGSFVQVADAEGSRWQVDGQLYDRDGCMLYAELKGHCPPQAFDSLLRCFAWPATPLMFQIIQQAVYLEEGEFRRYAARAPVGPAPSPDI